MKTYFQNIFALSDQGADDFIKSILWSTLLNISYMFPTMLGFYFLREAIFALEKQGAGMEGSVAMYALLSIVLAVIMYLIAIRQYHSCFSKTYDESARMRISLAEKLRKLPLSFFGQRDIADLSSTIMEDATQIEQLFSHAVPQMYASVVSVAFFAVGLTCFHWQMALALLWVIPVAALVFFGSKKFQKKVHKELHGDKLNISDTLQEGLDCMGEIKAHNYEKPYSDHLNALLDGYEKKLIRSELMLGALINVSHIPLRLGLVSVVIAGAWMFSNGMVDLFTYTVFTIVSASIYNPVIGVFENIALLMYLSVRINRKKEMDALPIQQGKTDCSPDNFDITFKNVSFSYDGTAQTLDNISFTAKQGEVTALVGPSGGGKSTTAKLAARFWDINSGTITLGGEDISQIDPETLLRYYAIVFQDVTLFNFSVMENIRIGKKDATDEEVLRAARLAQCEEFVQKLPDGYDTRIGENGERLSGGERQRISIARAILKDAPVILLDEATASLDAENETRIQKALAELIRDKTVLIIAHRMRTVRNVDRIVVIDQGKIVETGRPDDLLKAGGQFAAMNQKSRL